MAQAEVIRVLAEGRALHLLPPLSAIPALSDMCSEQPGSVGQKLTAACHQAVLSQLIPRSLGAHSLAAELVICTVISSAALVR